MLLHLDLNDIINKQAKRLEITVTEFPICQKKQTDNQLTPKCQWNSSETQLIGAMVSIGFFRDTAHKSN